MRVLAASSYPLLNAFWTMLIFFAWVIWIWLLITIFSDLFRRHDVSGWGKAGWTAFMLVLPFVGVLVYMISQGQAMSERRLADAQAQQQGFDSYVVQTKSGEVYAGIIPQPNADVIEVRDSAGKVTRLHKDQVKRLKRQPVSIMPEGLPAALSKEEFQDLLAFLQGLK